MLSLFIGGSFDEFAIVNNLTFATLCPLALDGSTISEAERCQYQIQRIGENHLGLCVRNLNTSDAPWCVPSATTYEPPIGGSVLCSLARTIILAVRLALMLLTAEFFLIIKFESFLDAVLCAHVSPLFQRCCC